ncbi:PH domain-containing protein [Microbulbifer yueqingensis]|uniref:PH domain-containing protein n=1 Tax=Microbulbifer yueqingensis TaxID=658219 RepID=A0A1G8UM41_9GAMM|nr:PH domain-containing protein [Microbulbifer yueqingensis]SDJ54898.1 PH domain-containing protein [Microbulbifer yueqingensis]
MPYQQKFDAPWSRQLKWLTALTSLLLVGIPAVLLNRAPENPPSLYMVSVWLPLVILALCTLFAIRGYAIDDNALYILRPLWKTRISLEGLIEVKPDPEAMRASIRVFGNSGLFGYIGLFRNEKTGPYRAFATDQQKAVVMRYPDRTVVVTPGRPDKLAALLEEKIAGR